MPLSVPAIQQLQGAIVDQAGVLKSISYDFFQRIIGYLQAATPILNSQLGVNVFALAAQPTLGAADAGYVGWVNDFAHLVTWDGAAWQWLDGDRPARFDDFAAAPGTGWALCDGSATTFLVVGGATLTTLAFTTPNLKGTPSYRKSAAAYTGTLNAASGSTASGVTGTDVTGSESSHTHDLTGGSSTFNLGANNATIASTVGGSAAAADGHVHPVTGHTDAGSAHAHDVPALTIAGLTVGTLDMPNIATLPYVRR